jgi:hypothetical protein
LSCCELGRREHAERGVWTLVVVVAVPVGDEDPIFEGVVELLLGKELLAELLAERFDPGLLPG